MGPVDPTIQLPIHAQSAPAALPAGRPPGRGGLRWLALVAVVVVALMIVGGGLLLMQPRDDASAPDGGQAAGATRTPTPSPTPTQELSAAPTPSSAPTPEESSVQESPAPSASERRDCGGSVLAGGTASCPFALAVAEAFRYSDASGQLTDVFSPVTGLYYDVTCAGQAPVECAVGRARIYIY